MLTDNILRVFANTQLKKQRRTPVKQIGTLTISIPTRRIKIDRKGRKRRAAVKFELPLMSGTGSLTARAAITQLQKDLQSVSQATFDSKLYRKIVQAFTSGQKK